MGKKIKNIVALLVAIMLIFSLACCGSKTPSSKEVSNYTDSEVIKYLKNEGFKFSTKKFVYIYETKYVYASNEAVSLQKIEDELSGISYLWNDDNINKEWADIGSEYQNDTKDKKSQLEAFEKWANYYNLTARQIVDALDYYGANTKEWETME